MINVVESILSRSNGDLNSLSNHTILFKEFSLFHQELETLLNYYHVLPEAIKWKFKNGIYIPEFIGEILVSSNGYGYGDDGYFFALVNKYQLAMFINLYFWQTRRDYYNEMDLDQYCKICNSVVEYLENYVNIHDIDLIDCIIKNI